MTTSETLIRIKQTPSGESPEEAREGLVGLVLEAMCISYEEESKVFVVDFKKILQQLTQASSPAREKALSWWEKFKEKEKFTFSEEECVILK
jgi:hypothetical protein